MGELCKGSKRSRQGGKIRKQDSKPKVSEKYNRGDRKFGNKSH